MLYFKENQTIKNNYVKFNYNPFQLIGSNGEDYQCLFLNHDGFDYGIAAFNGNLFMGFVTSDGLTFNADEAKVLEKYNDLILEEHKLDYYHYEVVELGRYLSDKSDYLKQCQEYRVANKHLMNFSKSTNYVINSGAATPEFNHTGAYIFSTREYQYAMEELTRTIR